MSGRIERTHDRLPDFDHRPDRARCQQFTRSAAISHRLSLTGLRIRTDLSITLFLSEPDEYDGGELVVEDFYGSQEIKLPAGDLVLYPATTAHRVAPVTRGERIAAFFWVESMVADAARRALLYELDRAIAGARHEIGDAHPAAVSLVGAYHNLVRMWCAP